MAIGNWGKDVVFRVSDSEVMTFNKFTHSMGSEWAKHSRIGKKDQAEYLRPSLQKLTFTITLDATLGVKPRKILSTLEKHAEKGNVFVFVVGGKRIGNGKWSITSLSETGDVVWDEGGLVRANVDVTMEEYV